MLKVGQKQIQLSSSIGLWNLLFQPTKYTFLGEKTNTLKINLEFHDLSFTGFRDKITFSLWLSRPRVVVKYFSIYFLFLNLKKKISLRDTLYKLEYPLCLVVRFILSKWSGIVLWFFLCLLKNKLPMNFLVSLKNIRLDRYYRFEDNFQIENPKLFIFVRMLL